MNGASKAGILTILSFALLCTLAVPAGDEATTLKFTVDDSEPLVSPNYFAPGTDLAALELEVQAVMSDQPCDSIRRCSVIVDGDGKVTDCGGPAFNCECVRVCADSASAVLNVLNKYR